MKSWVIGLLALPFSVFAGERVIAIGGDVTEIIYALGAGQTLVARDSTSQQPPQATALPNVGYMRQLNAEGILAMKPSLVIASDLAQPSLALRQVEQAGVKVVTVTGKPELGAIDERLPSLPPPWGEKRGESPAGQTGSSNRRRTDSSIAGQSAVYHGAYWHSGNGGR